MLLKLSRDFLKKIQQEGVEIPEVLTEQLSYNWQTEFKFSSHQLTDQFVDILLEKAKLHKQDFSCCNALLQNIPILISFRNTNAEEKIVKRLDSAQHALIESINKSKNKWVYKETIDGIFLPYLVTNVEYEPTRKDIPASLRVELSYLYATKNQTTRLHYEHEDIKRGVSARSLLESSGYYLESDVTLEQYNQSMEIYSKYIEMFSEQFIGSGIVESNHKRITLDGNRKMIQDSEISDNAFRIHDSGLMWNLEEEESLRIPLHPYLRMFDLTLHQFLWMHVNNLKIYEYDQNIKEKLILPDSISNLLDIITESTISEFDDIISGKSGGNIVIARGLPGTGKSLTAEAYSEIIKRPLYKVQSAQLGINFKELETNLIEVLNRANRWNANLLIDEADVFVHERGTNMEQNAVVGVFLRVLEYYNGFLMLTTNRTNIDDAILSRALAVIDYEVPEQEEVYKIIEVLMKENSLSFKSGFDGFQYINENKPQITGRSIKNILKLCQKLAKKDNIITKEMLDTAFNFVYINGEKDRRSIKKYTEVVPKVV